MFFHAVRCDQETSKSRVRDVVVAEIPRDADRRMNESDMNADKQVFYFSKKMFDFMCENDTAERTCQEGIRMASQRKADSLKRQKAILWTTNLREFVNSQW